MQPKTNSNATPQQLGTTGPDASENNRLKLTKARKTRHVRRSRCQGSSGLLVTANALDRKIQVCLDIVDLPALRQFLESVVQEPEVREVLASSNGSRRLYPGIRVDAIRTVALTLRQQSTFGAMGRDVVYVGALLHAIQYGLAFSVLGNANVSDVMFTIVRGPLHRLDDSDPVSASLLRLCMGWGNPDEAIELAEQLQQVMLRALRSMDRVNTFIKEA